MDLQDQLKSLFPEHQFEEKEESAEARDGLWIQDEPLLCKYEKRRGKATTIIAGYNGAKSDFKQLAKDLKTQLGVGGSVKNDEIIIQGDYRQKIMTLLEEHGFQVKRVGG